MNHQQNMDELDPQADVEHLPESMQPNVICPHCAHKMTELDQLCPNCGGPVTATAMIDPMSRIYGMGFCARRLTPEITSKPIVVLGAWLILGPIMLFSGLISLIALDQYMATHGWGFLGATTFGVIAQTTMELVLKLLLSTLIFIGSLVVLFKMTKAAIGRRQSMSENTE